MRSLILDRTESVVVLIGFVMIGFMIGVAL